MDNSDFNQKIRVRMKGLALNPNPKLIIDMFAGEGHISRSLWSKFNAELICIEKEQTKINKLDFDCKKICGDNKDYMHLTSDADIIDLDAYGLVMRKLSYIVDISKRGTLIYFTESNPFSKYISKTIDDILKLDITAFWIEKSNQSKVYYGYVYK